MTIDVKLLSAAIGAEITGVDLAVPVSTDVQDAIYQVLIDRSVIFFPGQDITPAAHRAFAATFGTLGRRHPLYAHVPGFDEITLLSFGAGNPPDTDGWHTDLTFQQNPPFASVLVARDLPPVGGDTLWSSLCAAYDALPDEVKAHVAGKVAVHDMGEFRNEFAKGESDGIKITEAMQRFGCAVHPMVATHPVTGRPILYVNEGFTIHVVGMNSRQSRRLLTYLFDHLDRPEYQVRHTWQPGTLAMWDNRCTSHYAVADYLPAPRTMHRITVVDDARAK